MTFRSSFAVDLADLWEIGRYHEEYLNSFLKLKFPRDLDRLESLLINWIEVQLLVHCQWHLRSLRKVTPKIIRRIRLPYARKRATTARAT